MCLCRLFSICHLEFSSGSYCFFYVVTENHRLQTEFDDNFITKMFLFQFVNFYTSLFYIAFIKGKWGSQCSIWCIVHTCTYACFALKYATLFIYLFLIYLFLVPLAILATIHWLATAFVSTSAQPMDVCWSLPSNSLSSWWESKPSTTSRN